MATEATKIAIDAGFHHIDAAYLYPNEEEVGLAIRSKIANGTVKREDIFYASKVLCTYGMLTCKWMNLVCWYLYNLISGRIRLITLLFNYIYSTSVENRGSWWISLHLYVWIGNFSVKIILLFCFISHNSVV